MELGYKWTNADANFDNVFNALITVFILCTQENWPFIMHSAMDSNPSEIVTSTHNFHFIDNFFLKKGS